MCMCISACIERFVANCATTGPLQHSGGRIDHLRLRRLRALRRHHLGAHRLRSSAAQHSRKHSTLRLSAIHPLIEPSNPHAQQRGNQLIVEDARSDNAGTYRCKCLTAEGNAVVSEHILDVQSPGDERHLQPIATVATTVAPLPPRRLLNGYVEYSDVGTSVTLNCDGPAHGHRYQWTRQHGKITGVANTTSVSDQSTEDRIYMNLKNKIIIIVFSLTNTEPTAAAPSAGPTRRHLRVHRHQCANRPADR